MKKNLAIFAAIAAFASFGSVHAAGNAADGKAKSATCAACHGADGNSMVADNPKLAGQHADYLLKQLMEFKNSKRKNPIMSGQVAGLSEQDMADLAAYFASQSVKVGSADKKLVALGKKIYRAGNAASGVSACIGCHGPTGTGNPAAKFPSLSGQHAKYIETQLKAFRNGTRNNDAGSMMRNIAEKMTDAEMKAVASYIAGLH
jgi:cytochrome c553